MPTGCRLGLCYTFVRYAVSAAWDLQNRSHGRWSANASIAAPATGVIMGTFFSDHFQVEPAKLESAGVVNVSLVADLPLFVDPFLLFNSKKPEYNALHNGIIQYLLFLKDKAAAGVIDPALLKSWYCFPEVKQTWLGFSKLGNAGSGLGMDFARALHRNLHSLFANFGREQITKGTHLEKVCLVRDKVGRDNISDFTTNLIKYHLCTLTEAFAKKHLQADQLRRVSVANVEFSYESERWMPRNFDLPWTGGDYVLLCPKDMLTKDNTWINREDLTSQFEDIPDAIPDDQLRAQINNYFEKALDRAPKREPTKAERESAALATIRQFPELIDWYIRYKEEHGDEAIDVSKLRLQLVEDFMIKGAQQLVRTLGATDFYKDQTKELGSSYEEAHRRLAFFKHTIENSGYRQFYIDGKPIQREDDVQRLFRYVWFDSSYTISPEVNHGRGPADFEVCKGSANKTIVEMKLAKNSQLKKNLQHQAEIYQHAANAGNAIKVIIYFSYSELQRVQTVLKDLKLAGNRDIVLIDARNDNKPSGSKAG